MSSDDYLRQQAWDYFALHAQQRLTTVRFYLIVAAALTAAAAASFGENFPVPRLGFAAGLLLSVLSFAFWRLDLRNGELIKAAEAALRSFEARDGADDSVGDPPIQWLFTREYRESERRRREAKGVRRAIPRSYSHVFNVVYGCFFFAGLLIAAFASV